MAYNPDYLTSASNATVLATYLSSASAATALAPYLTSASAASAYAPVGTYITSASASALFSTVAPAAGVSATGATQIKVPFTGTNYHALDVYYYGKANAGATNPILFLYTDGGTTPFLTFTLPTYSATASDVACHWKVIGSNAISGLKAVRTILYRVNVNTTQPALTDTATANTGVVNCVGVCMATGATTVTVSSAMAYVRASI